MTMLDHPLMVSGELARPGGDKLERRVTVPRSGFVPMPRVIALTVSFGVVLHFAGRS